MNDSLLRELLLRFIAVCPDMDGATDEADAKLIARCRAALTAAPEKCPAMLDSKITPREPTKAMIIAAYTSAAFLGSQELMNKYGLSCGEIWRAMYDAAPPAAAPENVPEPVAQQDWKRIAWVLGMRVLQSELVLDDEETGAVWSAVRAYGLGVAPPAAAPDAAQPKDDQ